MIKNIVSEFRIMLFENDWMDYMSKISALEKVILFILISLVAQQKWNIFFNKIKADNIDVKIGYPDYTFIDYHLNYIYKDVRFYF